MIQNQTWRASALHRARMKRSMRYAGLRFTEERGLFRSVFEVSGTRPQLTIASAVFRYRSV